MILPDFSYDIFSGSIYHKRCNTLKEHLLRYDIYANEVSRHTFKNKEYYVLEINLNHNNSALSISKALDIDKGSIHFIHINLKENYKIYWISEDLIHSKYLSNDSLLNFEKPLEDKAIDFIRDNNTFVSSIENNPADILIKLSKKK